MGLFDYPTGPAEEVPVEEVTFLDALSEADWKKILSVVETRHFRTGEEIVKLGEVDDSFYILSSGSVETLIPDGKGQWRALSVIPEGSVFGEIAFFRPRPAQRHHPRDREWNGDPRDAQEFRPSDGLGTGVSPHHSARPGQDSVVPPALADDKDMIEEIMRRRDANCR